MSPSVSTIISVLAVLTILAQIGVVVWLVAYAFTDLRRNTILRLLARHAYALALIVSFGATAGSLFLSSYAQFVPCSLCWWQRMFMFPIPIILAIAMWKKRREVEDYILSLSIFGGVIALYHTYIQDRKSTRM